MLVRVGDVCSSGGSGSSAMEEGHPGGAQPRVTLFLPRVRGVWGTAPITTARRQGPLYSKHPAGHLPESPPYPYRKVTTQVLYQLRKEMAKTKQITYKGIPIRLTADLSAETLQARREWQDIFKVMKGRNLQARLLYPARISFRFNR